MLLFASDHFSGVTPNKHGGSEGDHIKALRAMGADIPSSDNEIPAQLEYLFNLFMDVRFDRVPEGDTFKLRPKDSLGYNDIHYHSLLTGLELHKWEVDTLFSLNAIFDKAST